ncbi:uncharacterized protein Z518_06751 [Rhinocladiella mackenziei CBS 650.93]|uniref:Cytochrome P450 n=1 Tax=Rhinocladiella mackenziei CBS 650.93 TaxID=1442369 RepID=A0A0D2IBK3_9EURO|nr:uncharacterized protein Z518_06751 [Rhinocladiella mackenziei CBS 650.93]KIX03199.1 hypothetical protein Z518_06751 [Rhinocladiella mackenziei CBS 650.93]
MHISIYFLIALSLYLLFKVVVNFLFDYRAARRAQSLGCHPPPVFPGEDIIGISNARRFLQADRDKRFLDMLRERFHSTSAKEGRSVTTVGYKLMGSKSFITIEPRNLQALLATQFKDFALGDVRARDLKPLLGNGIFAADGVQWEHSRSLLRPQFVRGQISDLDLTERHVQNFMLAITFRRDGWSSSFDIMPLFLRLTIDSATEFLFGESVNSQLAALPGYERFAARSSALNENRFTSAFDTAQVYLAKSGRLGPLYWMAHNKEFRDSCRACHDFVDHFVKRALEAKSRVQFSRPSDPTHEKRPQKERYIFSHALAQQTDDPIEMRDHLMNILLAGRDTTASMLTWMFLLFAQYNGIYVRLRRVILEHFGTYERPRNLSFAGLKDCSYLQWTLNETLRLYPSVPFNSRRCIKDTTLPLGGGSDGLSPVFVRRGEEVNYSVHLMHRRKDIWGPDADDFRPDRWQNRKPIHAFEYLPFNAGPRICLGQQFALTEAGYVVVRLVQRFEAVQAQEGVGMPARGEPVSHALTLINFPAHGVTVRVREATEGRF